MDSCCDCGGGVVVADSCYDGDVVVQLPWTVVMMVMLCMWCSCCGQLL